jgi:hypothetical protein
MVIHYGKEGKMKKIILFTIVLLCAFSCKYLFPDEKFSFQREPYNGSALKINGYYYTQEGDYIIVDFFFSNGVVLSGRAFKTSDLETIDRELPQRYSAIRQYKYGWGIFLIRNSNIIYEMWDSSVGGGLPLTHYKGVILNDSTYKILEAKQYNHVNDKEKIWHFRPFAHKPDSTNSWIK